MFGNITIKEVKKQLGALVRLLRKRENLSQEELAEKLGLSRLTIQQLEAGKNPTIETVLKVLQHFDLLEDFSRYIDGHSNNIDMDSLY